MRYEWMVNNHEVEVCEQHTEENYMMNGVQEHEGY